MGKKLYLCPRGHMQPVSQDDWWFGIDEPAPPPTAMMCWHEWEDDICTLSARPIEAYRKCEPLPGRDLTANDWG